MIPRPVVVASLVAAAVSFAALLPFDARPLAVVLLVVAVTLLTGVATGVVLRGRDETRRLRAGLRALERTIDA